MCACSRKQLRFSRDLFWTVDQFHQQATRCVKPRDSPSSEGNSRCRRAHQQALVLSNVGQRPVQIVGLKTQVIGATSGFVQHGPNWRIFRQRCDQLNFGHIRVRLCEEVHTYLLNRIVEATGDYTQSEECFEHLRRRVELRHGHPHMQQLESQTLRQPWNQRVAPFCSSAL